MRHRQYPGFRDNLGSDVQKLILEAALNDCTCDFKVKTHLISDLTSETF